MNICEYLSPTPIKHIVLCGLKKFEKALFIYFFFNLILMHFKNGKRSKKREAYF